MSIMDILAVTFIVVATIVMWKDEHTERCYNRRTSMRSVTREELDKDLSAMVAAAYQKDHALSKRLHDRLLQTYDDLLKRVAGHDKDLKDAAGELRVEIPEPGTVMAKLLSANVLLKQHLKTVTADTTRLRDVLEVAMRYILHGGERPNVVDMQQALAGTRHERPQNCSTCDSPDQDLYSAIDPSRTQHT